VDIHSGPRGLSTRAPGAAQVAREWLGVGPSLVAITRGSAGTLVLTRAGTLDVAAPATHVADTVGAGDSFMAGLLTALADRRLLGHSSAASLKDIDMHTTSAVVDFAVRCAAITVSRHGADLPHRHDPRPSGNEIVDQRRCGPRVDPSARG
jgi:fructokinase